MSTDFENRNNYPQNGSLLKADDVAAILNVSRSFAYQLLQSGAIPVVRLGKACRVRPQDLDEYIERNLSRQGSG